MNALAGRNKLVLYLDFDGVLHHENVMWHSLIGPYLSAPDGYVLFQHARLLEQLLEPYPAVSIVLSTSWVRRYGATKAAKNLQPSLRYRVIGATFHSRLDEASFVATPRGMQVQQDVLRRRSCDRSGPGCGRLRLGTRAIPDGHCAAGLRQPLRHLEAHPPGSDPAYVHRVRAGRAQAAHRAFPMPPAYGFAIGSSSAGNSEMIFAPFGVRMTSSSIRAAEMPSVAGQ